MVMLSRAFALILVLSTGALADTTWTVDYYLRSDLSQYHTFYGPGSYDFLLAPDYITVYVIEPRGTTFGSTFLGYYGQVALPESMPAIRFPAGTDAAIAVPVSITTPPPTVTVPELAILPRLPRLLPRLFGWGVEARITHGLQRATTWLSAAILRAPHSATEIYLPSVTVSVVEACAGLQTLWLMLGAAALIAVTQKKSARGAAAFCAVLVGAAVVLALEANALRVAGIALGLEHLGALSREAKDWIQIGATGLALAQLVGIARLMGR